MAQDSLDTIASKTRVSGLTHGFYRYPAATSPELVRELIERLSDPDEIVLDPFMGGGTSVVEALASGRRAIGFDINELAVFVAKVKTRPLYRRDWRAIDKWTARKPLLGKGTIPVDPRLTNFPPALLEPIGAGLAALPELEASCQRSFVRCALLRTVQWALESRDVFPSAEGLTERLNAVVADFRAGMDELVDAARSAGIRKADVERRRTLIGSPAQDAEFVPQIRGLNRKIGLVVTSPPYPGVHILYHRWQVRSRRETPAPFWIANRQDGAGESYYTMGGRSQIGEENYFSDLKLAFKAIRSFLSADAMIVQIVAFNEVERQLPLFLSAMRGAGYSQAHPFGNSEGLTRDVPNRRWYARGRDNDAAREFVLFFVPAGG